MASRARGCHVRHHTIHDAFFALFPDRGVNSWRLSCCGTVEAAYLTRNHRSAKRRDAYCKYLRLNPVEEDVAVSYNDYDVRFAGLHAC